MPREKHLDSVGIAECTAVSSGQDVPDHLLELHKQAVAGCQAQDQEQELAVVEEVVKPIQSGRGIEEEIPLQVHADFDIQDLDPGLGQDEEMKRQSGTEDHEERKPRSYYTETKPHLKVREVGALEEEKRLREQRRRKRRAKEMETRARCEEDEARRYYRKGDERRAEAKRLRAKAAAYRCM